MMTQADKPLIGVINAGSSSIKFSVYEGERRLLSGQVDGLGARPSASATGPDGENQRGVAHAIALAERTTRREPHFGDRPSRRAWRAASFPAGPRHAGIA